MTKGAGQAGKVDLPAMHYVLVKSSRERLGSSLVQRYVYTNAVSKSSVSWPSRKLFSTFIPSVGLDRCRVNENRNRIESDVVTNETGPV